MNEVIEVSYTGDLLSHRRCARSWAYDKQAGFHPYEQVQAMEGRLVHHAMEWMTDQYRQSHSHVPRDKTKMQLSRFFRILWGRGIRTAFTSKNDTIERILDNLYFDEVAPRPTVAAVVEGAQHTEYELRAVKQLVAIDHDGKKKLMLTGILDVVIQQNKPLLYQRTWKWTDVAHLEGMVHESSPIQAIRGDLEIWDYKASRADSKYTSDYVRQLLTYARLYRERTGQLPKRCVIFYVNEPPASSSSTPDRQLLSVEVDSSIIDIAEQWTIRQVRNLQDTILAFQSDPCSVVGGRLKTGRVDKELKQQCTACAYRFDCGPYKDYLGKSRRHTVHPDVDIYNIEKN